MNLILSGLVLLNSVFGSTDELNLKNALQFDQ
jgi:hypothetical protein